MKIFKLFFVLLFGFFAITSCDEASVASEKTGQLDCIGFTKEELATVGELHNQYVAEVYQKVDFPSCDDCSDEIIEAFSEIEIDLSGINKTKEELISEAELLYQDLIDIQFDLRNWSDHPFSDESFLHLATIMDEMDEMGDYGNFVADMNQLQLIVDSDASLTCFDVELLTGTIEVAKNSAYLWMPIENGGLYFYSISQEGKIQPRWSWENAARADVTASAGYFLSLGGAAALGVVPGTNAAILGGWAFAAGFSSAVGGL